MKTVGVFLMCIGLLAFIYGGFSYLNKSRVLDAGPLQVSWHSEVPIPPIIGIVAVIGVGAALVATGRRRTA